MQNAELNKNKKKCLTDNTGRCIIDTERERETKNSTLSKKGKKKMKIYINPNNDKIVNLDKVAFIEKGYGWIEFHFEGNTTERICFDNFDPETLDYAVDPALTTAEFNKIMRMLTE